MPDLSQYSDIELEAMIEEPEDSLGSRDLSDYSDAELQSLIGEYAIQDAVPTQIPTQPNFIQEFAGDNLTDIGRGTGQGVTFGYGDELQAAIAAGVAAPFVEDRTYGQLYGEAKEEFNKRLNQSRERSPYLTAGGEIGGSVMTGAGAYKYLPQRVKGYVAANPIKGAGGLGFTSGSIYGFGAGEGGIGDRAQNAALYGLAGGVTGPAGAAVGGRVANPLYNKASQILKRKKLGVKLPVAASDDILTEVAEKGDDIVPVEGGLGDNAYGKVAKSLREDLGDDYSVVLDAYKKGDASLAELNRSRTKTLAKGAAQYSGGKAQAEQFFNPKIASSYDRVTKLIKENVSGVDSYHTTVDDLLLAGRAKATPLYKKAYEGAIDIDSNALPQEVKSAIAKARRQFPSELVDEVDNSVKVLDYAKRVLDDDIGTAQRAGKGNLAASRTKIKNALLETMDSQVPAYKEARAVSGDYLSTNRAMDMGKKSLKVDSELLSKQFKNLTPSEKEAFQIGMGKAIRDEVGGVMEGSNPYRRILGTPEKQKRIGAVLSPKQYKNLEKGLRAEDRLFKMRNEILGGSPTAAKQEAKNLIATTAQGVDDVMQVPRKLMVGGLKEAFKELDDKTASKVSEILYETDPIKKLEILDRLRGKKGFTSQEVKFIKKAYFEAAKQFDVTKPIGAITGGAVPAIIGEE